MSPGTDNAKYLNEAIDIVADRVRREFYLGIVRFLIDQVPIETWRKAVDVARTLAVEMDNDYTCWPPFADEDDEDDYDDGSGYD